MTQPFLLALKTHCLPLIPILGDDRLCFYGDELDRVPWTGLAVNAQYAPQSSGAKLIIAHAVSGQ
jgi:hypothetical protein